MVEERAAKGTHEKVVAQGVLAGQLPQPKIHRSVGVMTHHHRAGIAPGNETVVAPAIDLQLVLVEAVHQVARDHAVRKRCAIGCVQRERLVRQAGNRVLIDLVLAVIDSLRLRRQAAPDRRQGGEQGAVAVALSILR